MKKIVLILMLILCALNTYAQFPNQILGCVLGVTREEQVINILKGKGYMPLYYNSVLYVKNSSFGGLEWPAVCFYFKNDRLAQVKFIQDYKTTKTSSLIERYKYLKSVLIAKYRDYILKENKLELYLGNEKNETTAISLCFDEELVAVTLQYVYFPFYLNDSQERERGIEEL